MQLTGRLFILCQDLLTQALTLATLDGAQPRPLMRAALCELACLAVAGGHIDRLAACLKLAHSAANHMDLLVMSSHLLQPVAVAQMPEWAVAYVKGQEQAFFAAQVGWVTGLATHRLLPCPPPPCLPTHHLLP